MATFHTLLDQAKQISGSATYDDALTVAGAETDVHKSLEKDLNYVRSQLKAITGETTWYDAPGVALADIEHDEQGMSGSFANIYDFVGMDDRNDITPTYSSTDYVANDDSLETAIGKLDAQVKLNADGYAALDLDDVCDNGALTDNTIQTSGSLAVDGSIRTNQNMYVNYDGADADSYLYFYEGTSPTGRHLKWDDGSNLFELNDALFAAGSIMAGAQVYVNYDGPDQDSHVYFYENSTENGASLKWDDDPGTFQFDHALDMSSNKITSVTDPTSNQDAATKKYVDDNTGANTAATLDNVCENGAVTDVALTVSASGSTFSSLTAYDDLHVGGNIIADGTVDGVDIAGFASAAQTFAGMDSATDSTPSYSSTIYVDNDDSLETAIGKLDAAISIADVDKEVERLLVDINSGSAHTIPGAHNHAAGDGSAMDIYLNGQLMQSNTGTEFRDYIESDTDEVTFTFKVKKNSYLTYIIRS